MPVGKGQGATSHVWNEIFPTTVQSLGGEVSSRESGEWKVGLQHHSVASRSEGSESSEISGGVQLEKEWGLFDFVFFFF